jgi:hypothetical protein
MNAFASKIYRDLTCGAAAALITLVLSVTFVQSTALVPGERAPAERFTALRPDWFGRPEPAVLVD